MWRVIWKLKEIYCTVYCCPMSFSASNLWIEHLQKILFQRVHFPHHDQRMKRRSQFLVIGNRIKKIRKWTFGEFSNRIHLAWEYRWDVCTCQLLKFPCKKNSKIWKLKSRFFRFSHFINEHGPPQYWVYGRYNVRLVTRVSKCTFSVISPKRHTAICWSGQPTRTTPTHSVSAVRAPPVLVSTTWSFRYFNDGISSHRIFFLAN